MDKEVDVLLQAMRAAGSAINALRESGFAITTKANSDLVTQADLLANDILRSHLLTAFPTDGWLSEENVDDRTRQGKPRIWIVDPIDGTKEFVRGIPEFAISVALIEDGLPVVASVFNPATHELFHAVRGQGAWLNGKRIHCLSAPAAVRLVILASRSEDERGEWDAVKKTQTVKIVGSIAYKLALIAAGRADGTFSLGPKNEWDIAGGVLLVLEAGGMVRDRDKQEIRFNRPNVLVNGIVATTRDAHPAVFSLIKLNG